MASDPHVQSGAVGAGAVEAVQAPPSPLAAFWASFCENRGAVMGLALLSLIVFVAVFAEFVSPYSPVEQFRDFTK